MEMIIRNENQEIQKIDFNYEELKNEIVKKVEEYKNMIYTEDTVKTAKEDRAKLNKLMKAIADKRIEMKKKYLESFNEFENQAKELEAILKDGSNAVDGQVKIFEQDEKDKKLKEIVIFFESEIEELAEILNFDKLYKEEWLNKTYKIKDIEEEIKGAISKVKADLEIIDSLKTEFDLQIKDTYLKTLNLSSALSEKTRLEEQKEKLEKMKEKQIVVIDDTKNLEIVNTKKVNYSTKEELQQIDFRVHVTQEQKFNLREFIMKNNIKYEKVPINDIEERAFKAALEEAISIVQDCREEGENDLRAVLYRLDYIDYKEIKEGRGN